MGIPTYVSIAGIVFSDFVAREKIKAALGPILFEFKGGDGQEVLVTKSEHKVKTELTAAVGSHNWTVRLAAYSEMIKMEIITKLMGENSVAHNFSQTTTSTFTVNVRESDLQKFKHIVRDTPILNISHKPDFEYLQPFIYRATFTSIPNSHPNNR
jgi:hypothetical protein